MSNSELPLGMKENLLKEEPVIGSPVEGGEEMIARKDYSILNLPDDVSEELGQEGLDYVLAEVVKGVGVWNAVVAYRQAKRRAKIRRIKV